MAKRLLIVSPNFPPVNAPDMQRVRMALPYFIDAGWRVTVLTVNDPTPVAPLDPELAATIPDEVTVVRAHCLSRHWTRWIGLNNVVLRSLPFLFFRGWCLLAGGRHDVVYFSTSLFNVLPLGRIWRKLTGTPYVIDLQDPWVTDFYDRPGAPPPPGGWKYRFSHFSGRLLERWSLRKMAQLITVSIRYGESLRERHPDLAAIPVVELPFGSPDPDLENAARRRTTSPALLPPGPFRLVFAGALGPGMLASVDLLFATMAEVRRDGLPVSAHFFGTSYAPEPAAQTLALAARHGLQECVHENPARLPYLDALQVTLEGEVNLLLGSTDLDFVPSKLLTVLTTGRPVLALAPFGSAMNTQLEALRQPCITFDPARTDSHAAAAVTAATSALREFASQPGKPKPANPALAPYRARAVALRQLEILDQAAASRPCQ